MEEHRKRKSPRVQVSKKDIEIALRKLGLKKGDIVGIHSSLSSFGYVKDGADAVIDALLDAVGREGTIIMPTHSTNRTKVDLTPEEVATGVLWLHKILPFNPEETPCSTGVIPENFRKKEGRHAESPSDVLCGGHRT